MENEQKTTILEQLEKESKDLKRKNEKLNELVQIGVRTYQDENQKVQDLEQRLATYKSTMNNNSNGDDQHNVTATNGN